MVVGNCDSYDRMESVVWWGEVRWYLLLIMKDGGCLVREGVRERDFGRFKGLRWGRGSSRFLMLY